MAELEYMPLLQEAPMLVGVLWMFQVIAFILVALRLYTRLIVIHNYGMDDHFFNLAVVILLAYVIILTVAARYGLGQEMTDAASPVTIRALLLINIGQTVIFVAVIAVKISIACFLLRIVGDFNKVKKWAIILPVTIMSLTIVVSSVVLWFSCTPLSFVWDISTPGGYCSKAQQYYAGGVSGVMVILAELCSAACSIMRMVSLLSLLSLQEGNYLILIVDGLIWHAADITTQLFCIAVTVCRPLYKDWLYRMIDHIETAYTGVTSGSTQDSTYGAKKGPDAVALRSIGGGMIKPVSDGPGRRQGRPAYMSKKPGAALRRDLEFQDDVEDTKPATLPPVSTQPNFEKAVFPSATYSKYGSAYQLNAE
ncbi:hypothetical protein DHEL01_v208375 [Diaporthe helianthi]|uniref:Rhodopsin domain-containing protein n=1 Tax=Diaporthe helianthi TaxID=158607 RepID=A0A2P5HSK1_DIAHE|nr:hypothetical protein DHEL01_v208375 [Diaporthe helianthi]